MGSMASVVAHRTETGGGPQRGSPTPDATAAGTDVEDLMETPREFREARDELRSYAVDEGEEGEPSAYDKWLAHKRSGGSGGAAKRRSSSDMQGLDPGFSTPRTASSKT